MANNVLQLLRNQTVFKTKALALTGLQTQLKTLPIGAPAIAYYTDGDKQSLLFGIALGGTNYQIFEGCKVDEDGSLVIPEEVQTALDKIQAELDKTQGSIGLQEDGSYSATTSANYISGATSLVDADNKLDAAIKAVADNATKVAAGNGIDVQTSDHTATVAVKIDGSDKVLSVSGSGLTANINLTWSTSDGLKLIGKEGTEIATIPATDFIKDGMLENVELVELSGGTRANPSGLTDGTYIKFTFNTDGGSKVLYLNVTKLIDIYTAGNGISISGKVISAQVKSSDKILKVDSDGLYVDVEALGSQISNNKYNSAMPDELTTPNTIGGLKAGTKASDLKTKTLSQVFDDILFEEINPTVKAPSCSISPKGSWANNGVYEVGAAAPTGETDFNVSFNRGECTVVGQDTKYRAGEETSREIKLGEGELSAGAKITLGTITYNLTVNYGEGDTLLTSKGNNASTDASGAPISQNPLPEGSVKSSCNIYGTYPYFCNGASCSTSNQDTSLPLTPTPNTKLPLKKWSDTLIGAKFASEAETETRLEFIYPKAKNITKVEFFNTVSGKWEVFGSDKYTTSATEQKSIQGTMVDYMKLTTTGALSGALQLRFTVSDSGRMKLGVKEEPTYNGEPITDEIISMLSVNSATRPFSMLDVAPLADTGNRPSGVAAFAVNFEPGGQAPLDARTLVPSVSDLTNPATYSGKNYYKGMTVTVADGGDGKPSIYILKNTEAITSPESWHKMSAEATDITLSGYTRSEETGSGLELKPTDSVVVAFGKMEKAIIDNEEVCSNAFDAMKTAIGLGEDLTYQKLSGTTYLGDATSFADADTKLDAAIKAVSDKIDAEVGTDSLTEVEAGNGISVSGKSGRKQTISAKVKSGDTLLEVTAEGIKTKDQIVIDCGIY